MEVQVINKSGFNLPEYQTPDSAGVDIKACFDNGIDENFIFGDYKYYEGILELEPGTRALIPTGIYTAIPMGYEVQIRPRSGLALKHGVTVLNTPGTIDADYRDEWGIILINNGNKTFTIKNGDRIAQAVLAEYKQIKWREVESLDDTERKGGFGHTGTN